MYNYSLIIFVAVNIFFVDEATATALIKCRICTGARYLDDCPNTQLCSHDEECYMDKKVSGSGNIEYSGGCRSKLVCSTAGKKKSDAVACTKCCDRDDCNTEMCDFPLTKPPNATRCWSCPNGVEDIRHCNDRITCADNELCYSSTKTISNPTTHSVKHYTKCLRKEFCTALTMAVMEAKKNQELQNQIHNSKRETTICDICCGSDFCNSIPCITIRDRFYAFYKLGRLNNETLTVQMHHP